MRDLEILFAKRVKISKWIYLYHQGGISHKIAFAKKNKSSLTKYWVHEKSKDGELYYINNMPNYFYLVQENLSQSKNKNLIGLLYYLSKRNAVYIDNIIREKILLIEFQCQKWKWHVLRLISMRLKNSFFFFFAYTHSHWACQKSIPTFVTALLCDRRNLCYVWERCIVVS